jgi:hypothetical protein
MRKQKELEEMKKYHQNKAIKESIKVGAEQSKTVLLSKLKNDVDVMR